MNKTVLLCISKEEHNRTLVVGAIYFKYTVEPNVGDQYRIKDESLNGGYLKTKFIEVPYNKYIRLLYE